MKKDNINKNLIALLKLFNNRPYHLSQFLIDNNALNNDFIKKLDTNDKLINIDNEDLQFNTIDDMKNYYNSLVEDTDNKKSKKDITKDINKKLRKAIENEKYEEAAQIRDYMILNKIKKI